MKRIARSLFVLTLLVVAAQPMYACIECNWDGTCIWTPENVLKCKPNTGGGGCTDHTFYCYGLSTEEPLAAEFRIASVEISHESDVRVAEVTKENKTEAPAAVAAAKVDQVRK